MPLDSNETHAKPQHKATSSLTLPVQPTGIILPLNFLEQPNMRIILRKKDGSQLLQFLLFLLLLAAKVNDIGKLMASKDAAYSVNDIALLTDMKATTVQEMLDILVRYGFIATYNEQYFFRNFNEWAYIPPHKRRQGKR